LLLAPLVSRIATENNRKVIISLSHVMYYLYVPVIGKFIQLCD